MRCLPSGATDWTYQTDNAGATPRGLEREVLVAKDGETIRRIGFASPESGKVVVQKEVTPRAAVGRRLPRRVVLERYDLASGDKGTTVEVPYVYQFADLSPSGKSVLVAFAQRGQSYERLDVLSVAPKKHVAAWRPYGGERVPDEGDNALRRPRTFGMSNSPQSVAWAALVDDDHVLTVNTAGKLICWRMPECQAVYVFEEFGEPLALSPGRRYLAGNHFGQFRLFDTRTGKCVGDLQSPQYGSRAVRGVFRSDGRELAAIIDAGPDKMLARWDLKDGQLAEEFPVAAGGDHRFFAVLHVAARRAAGHRVSRRGAPDDRRPVPGGPERKRPSCGNTTSPGTSPSTRRTIAAGTALESRTAATSRCSLPCTTRRAAWCSKRRRVFLSISNCCCSRE